MNLYAEFIDDTIKNIQSQIGAIGIYDALFYWMNNVEKTPDKNKKTVMLIALSKIMSNEYQNLPSRIILSFTERLEEIMFERSKIGKLDIEPELKSRLEAMIYHLKKMTEHGGLGG